jgi:hypothetical protein
MPPLNATSKSLAVTACFDVGWITLRDSSDTDGRIARRFGKFVQLAASRVRTKRGRPSGRRRIATASSALPATVPASATASSGRGPSALSARAPKSRLNPLKAELYEALPVKLREAAAGILDLVPDRVGPENSAHRGRHRTILARPRPSRYVDECPHRNRDHGTTPIGVSRTEHQAALRGTKGMNLTRGTARWPAGYVSGPYGSPLFHRSNSADARPATARPRVSGPGHHVRAVT